MEYIPNGDFDLAGKQKLTTSLRDEQKMFDLFKERQTLLTGFL